MSASVSVQVNSEFANIDYEKHFGEKVIWGDIVIRRENGKFISYFSVSYDGHPYPISATTHLPLIYIGKIIKLHNGEQVLALNTTGTDYLIDDERIKDLKKVVLGKEIVCGEFVELHNKQQVFSFTDNGKYYTVDEINKTECKKVVIGNHAFRGRIVSHNKEAVFCYNDNGPLYMKKEIRKYKKFYRGNIVTIDGVQSFELSSTGGLHPAEYVDMLKS